MEDENKTNFKEDSEPEKEPIKVKEYSEEPGDKIKVAESNSGEGSSPISDFSSEEEPIKVEKESFEEKKPETIKIDEPGAQTKAAKSSSGEESSPISDFSSEEEPMKVEDKPKKKIKKTTLWQGISVVLAILLIVSIYTGGFKGMGSTGATVLNSEGLTAVIINDERCDTCDTTNLKTQLTQTFQDIEIVEYDYSSDEGKSFYKDAKLTALPAILFTDALKAAEGYDQVERYVEESGDYLTLKIGSSFDPEAEICDNEIDDTGNGKIDCEDETCEGEWKCMEKLEKPVVEAFVMSHCPFGTQIEKGLLPVVELLGDKIDFELKFCDYAMHGEIEVYEQLSQYCIQSEQNDKFIDYLTCFLEAGESDTCVETAGINKLQLETCKGVTDAKFKITENLEDKDKWRGNFPIFTIYQKEVDKYGIRGSPGLVINGVTASTARDPASLLNAICTGFKEKPSECDEELSTANPSSGFGFEEQAAASSGSCG
ncbi:hypothetical protein GOV06_01430 [Candidatus Woesearchaeota archaeon]|nr:hypothetical protein [Candidatus Woesearchaeota archaeon]